MKPRQLLFLVACQLVSLTPFDVHAQESAPAVPLPLVSGPEDDRLRVAQLLGLAPTEGDLLRSTGSLATRPSASAGSS